MRTGIIFPNQPNSLEYYSRFDEVVCGELFYGGDPGDWAKIGLGYTGVHPQKHWLTHNCQQVPGSPGTWQYYTNPIKLTNPHSREWRVPGRPDLYDITIPAYQDAVIESAIRRAKHASKYHGAYITGLFWDSITSEWWWGGECPHPLARYRIAQADFTRKCRQACHAEGLECGGNVAHASVAWPRGLDLVFIEHLTINAAIPQVIADPARTFRLGLHWELVAGRDPFTQWGTLRFRYEPLMRPEDCVMVSGCDGYQAEMAGLMEEIWH